MKDKTVMKLVIALFYLDVLFIFVGIGASVEASYAPGSTYLDDVFSTMFWMANIFFGIQSLTYVTNFKRSRTQYKETIENALIKNQREKIAILVPMYNEEHEMVSANLIAIVNAAKDMANIYVLDDSTDGTDKDNRELCEKLRIPYIHRIDRHGYKAGALNEVLPTLTEEYVTVIDIDQMPSPDFLKDPVELLDRDPELALVQVPQMYSNLDASLLANMADAQQFLFYEILTEGKSVAGTMFSCGTNVIYRLKALKDVNYFDENNLTEDIATSVNMLAKGWKTLYYNKKLVFGRAPVTMEGYVNQQYRWARGSLALLPRIIKKIVLSKKFKLKVKIDWFSSGIWYLYGWFYLIFLLAPILAVLGIRILSINEIEYLVAWLPFSIINLSTFVFTHLAKKGSLKTVFYNMSINVILFPLSIMVTIFTILGRKKPFTTARTGGMLPWYRFTPQFIVMTGLIFAVAILISDHTWYSYITAFWGCFQFTLLLPIFWLNRIPKKSMIDEPVFKHYT